MSAGAHAWHEAGHAVAARLLGGRVQELTIESELDEFEAHARIEWQPASRRELAERSATVALAGPVAELLFQGASVLEDPDALASWRGDWDEADRQLATLHPQEEQREAARQTILRRLHEEFGDADGYERLARVADALEAHGTLDEGLFDEAAGF